MKKELILTLDFNNRMDKATVTITEPKTHKSTCKNIDVGSKEIGDSIMDGWVSGWIDIQDEKRRAIAEKRRKRQEDSETKKDKSHNTLVEICRKAKEEGLSYAKYVQKYGV